MKRAAGPNALSGAWPKEYSEAAVFLENYIESLKRDIPLNVKVGIRTRKKVFHEMYFNTKRELLMKQLENAIECIDSENFVKFFQEAFIDANKQNLKIRSARKRPLDFDFLGNPGCINPTSELYGCDEMIKWEFNEPNLTPKTKYEARWEKNPAN